MNGNPLLLSLTTVLVAAVLLGAGCDDSVPGLEYAPTTIIMVRHAEKAVGSMDPPLTEEGQKRARELVFALDEVELEAVYSTDLLRAVQTATPVAEDKGLEVKSYGGLDLEVFLQQVLDDHPRGTVLVVGHSGTLPTMLRILADEEGDYFKYTSYDTFLVVSALTVGLAQITPLQYRTSQP